MLSLCPVVFLLGIWLAQYGGQCDDKPSQAIEILNVADSSKWTSQGIGPYRPVKVQHSNETQTWYLQREHSDLLWSFHVVLGGRSLMLAYREGRRYIRMVFNTSFPATQRFFRLEFSSNGKFYIRTEEGNQFLCRKSIYLLLCPPGTKNEEIEWDIRIGNLSASHDFKAEIIDSTSGIRWVSSSPKEFRPIPVCPGFSKQYDWTVIKNVDSDGTTAYAFQTEGNRNGKPVSFYVAYTTHPHAEAMFLSATNMDDRSFTIQTADDDGVMDEVAVYYIIKMFGQTQNYTAVDTNGALIFTELENAAHWRIPFTQLHNGAEYFPPYDTTPLVHGTGTYVDNGPEYCVAV